MDAKSIDFDHVYDIRALRVVVSSIRDCYSALGVIHTRWRHVPREFDDYIANPKENGYRSIHTAVVGPDQRTVEIQIRTREMHREAELGVCAHWAYKTETGKVDAFYTEKLSWLRQVLAWHEEVGGFVSVGRELRSNIEDGRIYVFTPAGHVLDMPEGSTPVDFAYRVHTQIGQRCVGARDRWSMRCRSTLDSLPGSASRSSPTIARNRVAIGSTRISATCARRVHSRRCRRGFVRSIAIRTSRPDARCSKPSSNVSRCRSICRNSQCDEATSMPMRCAWRLRSANASCSTSLRVYATTTLPCRPRREHRHLNAPTAPVCCTTSRRCWRNRDVSMVSIQATSDAKANTATIQFGVEIRDLLGLATLLDRIRRVSGVARVQRRIEA